VRGKFWSPVHHRLAKKARGTTIKTYLFENDGKGKSKGGAISLRPYKRVNTWQEPPVIGTHMKKQIRAQKKGGEDTGRGGNLVDFLRKKDSDP